MGKRGERRKITLGVFYDQPGGNDTVLITFHQPELNHMVPTSLQGRLENGVSLSVRASGTSEHLDTILGHHFY